MHRPASTRVLPNVDPQETAVRPAREPATPGAAALTATLIIDTEAATYHYAVVISGKAYRELGSHQGGGVSEIDP